MSNATPTSPSGGSRREKRLQRWREIRSHARYTVLLVSLLTLGMLLPLVGGERHIFGISLLDICIWAVLISAVASLTSRRFERLVALILVVPMIVTTALSYWIPTKPIYVAEHISTLLFFAFASCMILRDVLRSGAITGDKIVGAICVYLFIGIIWSFMYSLTQLLSPGSFEIAYTPPELPAASRRIVFSSMLYHSFVTLSTLGYGDIIPVSPSARTLSWTEAVTGQLYLAILIARLVALHITHQVRPPQ